MIIRFFVWFLKIAAFVFRCGVGLVSVAVFLVLILLMKRRIAERGSFGVLGWLMRIVR
jgi:hypothetical protein